MKKTAKHISWVTGIAVLGSLVGLVSQILIAAYFGAGRDMDIYLAALVVPELLIRFTLGYVAVNFLPVFAKVTQEKGDREAWRLTSTLINYVVLFDVLLIAFLFFEGEAIYRLFLPGFSEDHIIIVVNMFRIMSAAYIFQSIATILTYICHYNERFIKSSIAPQFISFTVIASVLLLHGTIGAYSLAVGFVTGYFLQAAWLWSEIGRRYTFAFDFRKVQGLKEILRGSTPLVVSGFISNSKGVLERFFASSLMVGSIATLGFAGQFAKVFDLATTGITTVVFPKMSKAIAEKDMHLVGRLLTDSLTTIMLYLIPLAVFLGVFRYEIVGAVFERGQFTHAMTIRVGDTVAYYLGFLLLSGVGTVLGRGFYIRNKNMVPAALHILGTFLYIGLVLIFAKQLGVRGIALAMSLQFATTTIIIMAFLARIYPSFQVWRVLGYSLVYVLLSTGLALTLYQIVPSFAWYGTKAIIGGLVLAVSYLLLLYVGRDRYLRLILEQIGVSSWKIFSR